MPTPRSSLLLALALFGLTLSMPAQAARFAPLPRSNNFASQRTCASASGDLTGDGSIDIVTAHHSGSTLWINDGHGRFGSPINTIPPFRSRGVAVGDMDGDKDLDIILEDDKAGRVVLLTNDGRGKFVVTKLASGYAGYYILSGDIDADGDLDLVCPLGPVGSRLFLNNGKGKFTEASSNLPAGNGGERYWGGIFTDVDGDTDLDIVVATRGLTPAKIFLNDGKGMFTNSTKFPLTRFRSEEVASGDFDGDGDNDLYFATRDYYNSPHLLRDVLWLNDGKGGFTDATTARLPNEMTFSTPVRAADMDDDGDIDVVSGNRLYLNDGSGKFLAGIALPISQPSTIQTIDLDHDGDIDIFSGNLSYADQVLFNLHRQMYSEKRPFVGAVYKLDYFGRPGYASSAQTVQSALQLSRLPAHVRIPGIRGKLGLASPFVMLPPQVIPAPGGRARLTLPIPNSAALKGLKFYAQGVIGGVGLGSGWTNLWSDEVVR